MTHARRLILVAAAFAVLAMMTSCGSRAPAPPYTGQPTRALSPIPYPPPPARVETVPKRPTDGAVWIDGEWTWEGRRWGWKRGRWVLPPAGAAFAPWTTVRDKEGTLYFAAGAWRNANGDELPEPPAINVAKPGPPSVVNPKGHTEDVGPLRDADAGTHDAAVRDEIVADAGNRNAGDVGGDAGILDAAADVLPAKDGSAP